MIWILFELLGIYLQGKKQKGRQLKAPVLRDFLIKGNAIVNSSVMVRKPLITQIGGISEEISLITSEDYNTWLKISEVTDRFKYIPVSLGEYRVHASNTSSTIDPSVSLEFAILEFIFKLKREDQLKAKAFISYTAGKQCYFRKLYLDSFKYFRTSLISIDHSLIIQNIYFLILSGYGFLILKIKKQFTCHQK